MVAEQRLPEQLVVHVLRRRGLRLQPLRGRGLHQVELALRERRVAHDVGEERRASAAASSVRPRIWNVDASWPAVPVRLAPMREHLALDLLARPRGGAFLRQIGDELREPGLVGGIDGEARLDGEDRRDLRHGRRDAARSRAGRSAACARRAAAARTAARGQPAAASAPTGADALSGQRARERRRGMRRAEAAMQRSLARSSRTSLRGGLAAGRLSIDVRFAGTSHLRRGGLHVLERHLVELARGWC